MTQYSSDDDALQSVAFFCLTNHHAFVKFVFTPFYSTLLFIFFKRLRNGWGELIFVAIILTSLQNQSKRLGISLSFGLFLQKPWRAWSGNREEGDLKSCQEYSREMWLPCCQLCCWFWEAQGRGPCMATKKSRKAPPEALPRHGPSWGSGTVQKASPWAAAIKLPANHLPT